MEKALDKKGRWRNRTVSFRVSEEEGELLDNLVAITGLTKQEYISRKLLNRDMVIQGNSRVYKAIKNQLEGIYQELKRIEEGSEVRDELLYTLQVIAIALGEKKERKDD